jgi:hypothetical protein
MFVFHYLLSFGNIIPNYNIAPVGNSHFRYEISLYKFSRGTELFVRAINEYTEGQNELLNGCENYNFMS